MPFPSPLPARWLASAAARLMLLSGVGYAAAAYATSRALTRPRRRVLRRDPAELRLAYEGVRLVTEDGLTLDGWVVEPVGMARGVVALFHGMRRTREQMLARLQLLAGAGYRCVAVDHRAHGRSEGNCVSFGWYESRDVRAIERWIGSRFPSLPRFALGISMGTAALCYAGASCHWDGVILEGIYADVCAAYRRRIELMYPVWFRQLTPAVLWLTARRIGARGEQLRPADAVRTWRDVRVLGITGACDRLAPPSDGIRVIEAIPGDVTFFTVPSAGHDDVCEVGGDSYSAEILSFLESRQGTCRVGRARPPAETGE